MADASSCGCTHERVTQLYSLHSGSSLLLYNGVGFHGKFQATDRRADIICIFYTEIWNYNIYIKLKWILILIYFYISKLWNFSKVSIQLIKIWFFINGRFILSDKYIWGFSKYIKPSGGFSPLPFSFIDLYLFNPFPSLFFFILQFSVVLSIISLSFLIYILYFFTFLSFHLFSFELFNGLILFRFCHPIVHVSWCIRSHRTLYFYPGASLLLLTIAFSSYISPWHYILYTCIHTHTKVNEWPRARASSRRGYIHTLNSTGFSSPRALQPAKL